MKITVLMCTQHYCNLIKFGQDWTESKKEFNTIQNFSRTLFLKKLHLEVNAMQYIILFSPIETSLSPSRSPENEIKIEEINSPPSSPILGQKKKSGKQPNRKNSTSLLCNNKKVVNEYALEALLHSKLKPGDPGYYSPESLKRNSEMYPPLPIKIEKHSKVCILYTEM